MTDRHRTRGYGPVTSPVDRYINGVKQSTRQTTIVDVSEEMNDVVVPNFYKRRNAGEIINNQMSYVKDSIFCTVGGRSSVTQSGKVYEIYGSGSLTEFQRLAQGAPWYGGIYPAPTEPSLDAVQSAQSNALGNVDRSPYSFAEDIAEMRETFRFLKNPLGSLRDLSKSFKKDVDVLGAKKYLTRAQAIANVWLQYQFAFRPLVRSAHDLLEAQSDKIRRPVRRTARGKEEYSVSARGPGKSKSWYQWEGSHKIDSSVKAGILYEVSNPLNDWKYKYGLRFKDIPETLWAITPYSFMVDRMFNISQAVRGVVSFLDPNVKLLAAWTTQKRNSAVTLSYVNYSYHLASAVTIQPDVKLIESSSYNRTVWEPSFSDVVPPLELSGLIDTSTKLADLVALVLQRIR